MKYEELTDSQKEKARRWWWDLEKVSPAWRIEHNKSKFKALEAFMRGLTPDIIAQFGEALITGHCSDCLLYDAHKKYGESLTYIKLTAVYDDYWRAEMKSRNTVEYIEGNIMVNDYDFKVEEIVSIA